MNAVCGLDWRAIAQMDDVKLINEGPIAEQFIGQHLQDMLSDTLNRDLVYWIRQGRSCNAELDFVVQSSGQMIPVEVKAGATGTLKSLHQFMGNKNAPLAVRFDTSLPSKIFIDTVISTQKTHKQVQYNLATLPLYLVERLGAITAHYSDKETDGE